MRISTTRKHFHKSFLRSKNCTYDLKGKNFNLPIIVCKKAFPQRLLKTLTGICLQTFLIHKKTAVFLLEFCVLQIVEKKQETIFEVPGEALHEHGQSVFPPNHACLRDPHAHIIHQL